jgi:hypothetical protein
MNKKIYPSRLRSFMLLIFSLCFFTHSYAQSISYPVFAQAITRGLDSTLLTVRIDFPTTTTTNFITIKLGYTDNPGIIEYIPGSITKIASSTSLTIAESNISNLRIPVFSMSTSTTTAGDYIIFTIKRRANCGAASSTKDAVEVSGGAVFYDQDPDANAYPLRAPALTLIAPPTIANANVGTAYTRNITVTNGGNGCLDTLGFWLKYPSSSFQLNSVKIGVTTLVPSFVSTDSIYYKVSGSIAFGADKLFCNGETVTLIENITVKKCDALTTYGADWNAHLNNSVCETNRGQSLMTMSNSVPNLSATLTTASPYDYCFATGETKIQSVRLTNSGTGPAGEAQITLRRLVPGSFYGYIYFDTTLTWVVKNSSGTPIGTVSNFGSYVQATAYNSNCSQPATGLFDELTGKLSSSIVIPAGDYVTVEVVTRPYYFSCGISCIDVYGFVGIQSQLDYKNQCGAGNYTEQYKTLAARAYTYYAYSLENQSDINGFAPNNTFNLDIFFTYWMNQNHPNGTGISRLAIPLFGTGILPNVSTVTIGSYTLPVTVVNDTMFVTFIQNTPIVYGQLMRIPMIANCTAGGGTKTLQVFVLNSYSSCSPTTKMSCKTTAITIHCPTPCPKGGATPTSFNLKRINVGLPDNNNDGIPDASGVVNLANIQDHHSVNGDTLQGTWNIKVYPNTQVGDPNYGGNISYVYVDFKVAKPYYYNVYPEHLKELPGAQVTIYPAGGGAAINCTINPTRIGDTVAHYEISTACRGGFWQGGDSIVVKAKYTVSGYNTDNQTTVAGYKNVAVSGFNLLLTDNQVYSTYTQKITNNKAPIEGQTYTCDYYNDYNQISYIWISNYLPSGQVINGCTNLLTARVRQYTRNQEQASIFPNEYRNFYIPDEMRTIIPPGFTYSPNTAKFNNVATASISNANVSQVGDTLIFSGLRNFFTPYGGTLVPGDETTDHGVFFTIDPTCSAVPGSFFGGTGTIGIGNGLNTPATNYYQVQTSLQRAVPRAYSTGGVYNYAAPQPIISGGGKVLSTDGKASWDVVLQNLSNGTAANFSYLYLPITNSLTNIVVKEGATVITPDVNGFYQIGVLSVGANRTFTVTANVTNCSSDSIKFNQGWNCSGYPTSYAVADACSKSLWLSIENYNSQIQLAVTKQPDPIVMSCSGETLEFVMGSAQPAFADNPMFRLTPPQGLSFFYGEIEYPVGSGTWQLITPNIIGSVYEYKVEDHAQVTALWGTRGLPGTIDFPGASQRQAKLRITYGVDCSFVNGSKIAVQQRAFRACGGPISTALGYNKIVKTDPIYLLPSLSCIVGDTNFTIAPQVGNIEWKDMNWSLGHVPLPCESAQITFTGTGATNQTVTVNVTTNVNIKNLILLNKSTAAANDKVFKTIVSPGINMYMNGNVTMSSSAVLSQDSCIFNTNGGGQITVNGYTVIGYPADNGYCIFGAVPNATQYYNYLLKGNLTFNAKGFNRAKYTNITMDATDTLYVTNNTNGVYPNAVMFDRFQIGAVESPTLIFAGTNYNNFVLNNAGYVDVKDASVLILNENYNLNGIGTFNSSFYLRPTAELILRGNGGGQTGSNFPKNYATLSIDPTSTVQYDGRAFSPDGFTQAVYPTTYGNLLLSKSTGTGRAKKTLDGNMSAGTSITINPLVDFTLGAIGSTNANVVSNGSLNVLSTGGLYCNANVVSGTGAFMLNANSYFGCGHPLGISTSTVTGNMCMTGGRTFTSTSDYLYNGSVNQITGLGLPSIVDSFTVQNSGAANSNIVTNSKYITINGLADAKQGIFDLTTTKLTSNGLGTITSTGGKITARAGTIELKGTSGAQTLSGSWFIGKNIGTLINDNPVGFTNSSIPNDSLLISYALLYGAGRTGSTIWTNENLTLLSRDTGTASFGYATGNNIIGNVNVERYLFARKAWRLLATPVIIGTSPSIKNSWMEGGITASTGYGTQMTGPAGVGGGFDLFSQRVSIKYYNPLNDTHTDVLNTNAAVANNEGYFVFVRGDRSVGQFGLGSTILRIKGQLRVGLNQDFTFPTGAGYFHSFGNPYASRINFATTIPTQITNSFTVWNPNSPGLYNLGAYETYTKVGANYVRPGGGVRNHIESGEAVYLSRTILGSGSRLRVKETDKTLGSSLQSRVGSGPEPLLEVLMYVRDTVGSNTYMADGVMLNFDSSYSNGLDNNDVRKFPNAYDNLSVLKNDTKLVVERAPKLQVTDTIRLNISGMHNGAYRFDVDPSNLSYPELEAYLVDKYTAISTPLSFTDITSVNFDINTAVPSSLGSDRFMIVFKAAPTTDFTTIAAKRNSDNTITVNWGTANERNLVKYTVEQSNDGTNFTQLAEQNPTANNGTNPSYEKLDVTASKANNWYRIKANNLGGTAKYSAIAMVAAITPVLEIKVPKMSIYPNPVVNGIVNLRLENQDAGKYEIQVSNTVGQVLYKQILNVQTNNVLSTIKLNNAAKGTYILSIKDMEGDKVQLKFVVD